MMLTTEDFVAHDTCPRLRTWGEAFDFPRVNLSDAMHHSLRAGLLAGDPVYAKSEFINLASKPGLDISGNVYEVAVHHSALMEAVCSYLLGADGPWHPCGVVSSDGYDFDPQSYLLPDGRIRRVVLCSSWSALREHEERQSWRTVADICATGRPMLVNVIVIGQSRNGFRPSPWTQAYIHPENAVHRVKKKEGKFTENWKRVYRENTDHRPEAWLSLMQQDGAFDDLVYSMSVEIPERRGEFLGDMSRMAREIKDRKETPRRSGCFRFSPCGFSRLCNHTQLVTPITAGWERKPEMAVR